MATPVLRPLSLGEVLDTSFSLYRAAFGPLLAIAVVTGLIPQAISAYIEASGGVTVNPGLYLANAVLALLLGAIGIGAATFVVSERYLGRELPAGVAFGKAMSYLGRTLVLWILGTLVIFIGLVLLLVPGLIIISGLILAVPALMLEGLPSGTRAMSRSWELSRGLRFKALATVFVAYLMVMIPALALGVVAGLFGGGDGAPIVAAVVMTILATIIMPYLYVVVTVLYYDARVRKEAFDLEMLAAEISG